MRRIPAPLSAGVIAVVIILIVYGYATITSPRRELDHFLKQAASVEMGRTKLDDFLGQMRAAGFSDSAFTCRGRECGYGLRVGNAPLSRLRLTPITVIDCSVVFTDGIASEMSFIVEIAARGENPDVYQDKGAVVHEKKADAGSSCHNDYHLVVRHNYRAYQGDTASVTMDSCVSAENRAKALAINTACFTRIGGCKTIESILPRVFDQK
jgi:hypothetical protein